MRHFSILEAVSLSSQICFVEIRLVRCIACTDLLQLESEISRLVEGNIFPPGTPKRKRQVQISVVRIPGVVPLAKNCLVDTESDHHGP